MERWKPSLGGWLTIINCIGWLLVAVAGLTGEHYPYLALSMFLFSLPLAWLFLPPSVGHSTEAEVIVVCVVIGLNSILWGYGLAAILRRWFRRLDAAMQ